MSNKRECGTKKRRQAFTISAVLVVFSISLLLFSFLSLTTTAKTSKTRAENDDSKSTTSSATSTRLVFVVIDAWRLTFLTDRASPMKFVRDSVSNGDAVVFDTFARMPTVTLPRITAYVSGTIPSFGMVLTNLASGEVDVENWVTSAKKAGKRIHFFGDDTWLRMFPDQFDRSEGVTSFFVNDYTEVDDNVTRHLDEELGSSQWDVLVLHYLGLDHVGHSLGGKSPKINEKLMEMDRVVERIYSQLAKKRDEEVALIVCGDHGMTEGGSHGGSSREETRVPVAVWMTGKHRRTSRTKSKGSEDMEQIEQIDVSATIFSLLGLSFPSASYGISLIPTLARSFFFDEETIRRDGLNSWQHFQEVSRELGTSKKLSLNCSESDDVCDFTKSFVQDVLRENYKSIQDELIDRASVMPGRQVIIAFALLVVATFCSFSTLKEKTTSDVLIFALSIIYFASSLVEEEHEIWYYVATTLVFVAFIRSVGECCGRETLNSSEKYREVRELLIVVVLHRIAFGWKQGLRRRWAMDPDLLPPPIFAEFPPLLEIDLDSLLSQNPQLVIVVVSLLWTLQLKSVRKLDVKARILLIGPFVSHVLRCNSMTRIPVSSYLLIFHAVLISLGAIVSLPSSLAIFSLILCPTHHLPLLISIFVIGRRVGSLDVGHSILLSLISSSFFYTGNSNSLSTLDLSSAYVGLVDYHPLLVGIQLLVNTYSGPIMFLYGWITSDVDNNRKLTDLAGYIYTYRIAAFATSLLCLYVFQQHLFVWSVYAPKVVYDMSHCIITLLLSAVPICR